MRLLTAVLAVAAAAPAHAAPPIQTRTLSNGLEVLVVEVPGSPLATVEIAVRNGSMTEPPETNGLSHLYEHMFFKANAVIADQEAYLARARELGLRYNGTTDTERVNYFFTTTTDHLADAMAFMRDAAVGIKFDPGEFEKEGVVVTGEIDRNESNPYYHFFHETAKHVWWKYPSRKDPLGNRKTVLAATIEQMRAIQRRYYVPNNSALIVTGGVRSGDVFAQAERLYAGWEPTPERPLEKYPLVKHPPIRRTELVLVEQPVRTVTGVFTWHGPSTVGRDVDLTYAADLQTTALAQPSSRFQKALVDSGACLRAGLVWYTQMNTGPIYLSFDATPEKATACLRAIQAELPKMLGPDYLAPEELADAAHRLEVDRALENEKPSDLAHTLSFWWTSAGLDYYRTYLDRTRAVRAEDISRYLRTYVLGRPYVLGMMVSKEMEKSHGLGRAQLEKLAVTIGAPAATRAVAGAPPPSPPSPPQQAPPARAGDAVLAPPVTDGDVTHGNVGGVRVIVRRAPGAELVALQLAIRGGVANVDARTAGIELLGLQTAARGGAGSLDKDAFQRRLTKLGSTLEAQANPDFSLLQAKSLRSTWEATFDLLADAFLRPALPAGELELQRQLQLQALKREQEDPDAALRALGVKTLFRGHPYALRPQGSEPSVQGITLEGVRAHLARLRAQNRLLVVVVGEVDPTAVFARVDQQLGSLPGGDPLPGAPAKVSFSEPTLVVDERPIPTNYVLAAFPGPGWNSPDFAASRLAMSVLQFRESLEVRTKRNLSYAPGAGLNAGYRQSWGWLYVSAVDPAATLPVMQAEVKRLQVDPVPARELEGSRSTYLTGYLMAEETTDGQAASLASAEILGGDWRMARTLPDRIRRVTAEEIRTFASAFLGNYQVAAVGDRKKIDLGMLR